MDLGHMGLLSNSLLRIYGQGLQEAQHEQPHQEQGEAIHLMCFHPALPWRLVALFPFIKFGSLGLEFQKQ